MKKVLLAITILVVAGLLWLPWLLGIAPGALSVAPAVFSGLAAKLACSGYFVSGLSPAQLSADIGSYSGAIALLAIDYDENAREVQASLTAVARQRARFREGLGCTLEIGDTAALDTVRVTPVPASTAAWPAGNTVDTTEPAVQTVLAEILREDNAAGLDSRAWLLVHRGRIIAETYADGITPATPLLGWSMGKSVTAILLGSAERSGLLASEDSDLFPRQWRDERAGILMENLLQMVSGLAFDETYAPGSDSTRMLFTASSAADVALASPLTNEPGEFFHYSSGTTNILARLLHEKLGADLQTTAHYINRALFRPLGMAHSVFEPDPSGVFVGSSYIYASARDWARLGQLLLDGGELNGHRIVEPDWVERAVTPNGSLNDPRYGYQLWLNAGGDEPRWPSLPGDTFAMQGNRSQAVLIIPSRDAVLVRLGWSAEDYPLDKRAARVLAALPPADLERQVRCREIAFSQSAEARDAARFTQFIDKDARFVGSSVSRGPEAVAAAWQPFLSPGGPAIKWRPQFVEVLEEGGLALSRGPYRVITEDESGVRDEHWGTFNSVWRRGNSGRWEVVFDAGSPAGQPPSAEHRDLLERTESCN